MVHQIIPRRLIQWLNKYDYDIQLWVGHRVFDSSFTLSITTPNLKWSRVKFRTRNRLLKLLHRGKNLLWGLVGYRLVDAQYNENIRVFKGVEDISDTTMKALVPRKWNDNKSGWAIRVRVDEDDRMLAGENGIPLHYKDYCTQMGYVLKWIGDISFVYAWSNKEEYALLKAAAGPKNLDNWVYNADSNKHIRRYEPKLRKNRP